MPRIKIKDQLEQAIGANYTITTDSSGNSGFVQGGIEIRRDMTTTQISGTQTPTTSGLFDGQLAVASDTKMLYVWDSTTSKWMLKDAIRQSFTPTWTSDANSNTGTVNHNFNDAFAVVSVTDASGEDITNKLNTKLVKTANTVVFTTQIGMPTTGILVTVLSGSQSAVIPTPATSVNREVYRDGFLPSQVISGQRTPDISIFNSIASNRTVQLTTATLNITNGALTAPCTGNLYVNTTAYPFTIPVAGKVDININSVVSDGSKAYIQLTSTNANVALDAVIRGYDL
jgi:hypothetical protein